MNVRRVVAAAVAATAGVAGVVGYVVLRDDDSSADSSRDYSVDLAVVGDSFIEQSRDQIQALAETAGLTADVQGFGGSSICSWDPQIDELAADPPRILVLSFAGNDIPKPGNCFNSTGKEYGPEGTAVRYRVDLDDVLAMFPDSQVYVVPPPPIRDPPFEAQAVAMRAMYREAIEDHDGLRVIDVATTLDPDDEGFVESLPCEEWDECPASGEVTLRKPDGIHLTPAGAERYARAVIAALD